MAGEKQSATEKGARDPDSWSTCPNLHNLHVTAGYVAQNGMSSPVSMYVLVLLSVFCSAVFALDSSNLKTGHHTQAKAGGTQSTASERDSQLVMHCNATGPCTVCTAKEKAEAGSHCGTTGLRSAPTLLCQCCCAATA